MNIACPKCGTVYRLPDEKYRPGLKLRCSVCRNVFLHERKEDEITDLVLPSSESDVKSAEEDFSQAGVPGGDVSRRASLFLPEEDDALSMDGGTGVHRASSGRGGGSLELGGEGRLDESGDGKLSMPSGHNFHFQGLFSLILCGVFAAGGWWLWTSTPYLNGIKNLVGPYLGIEAPKQTDDGVSMISQLELVGVSQSNVTNAKLGNLVVLAGKIRNNFPYPRGLVRVEAGLYDAQGKCLAEKRQLAGAALGKYQLESFSADELKDELENKLQIMDANTNVISGGEIPFTVVFSNVPEGASDYKVRIVEARIPHVGNLTE